MLSSGKISWRRLILFIAITLTGAALGVYTLTSRLPAQTTPLQSQTTQPTEPAPYNAAKLCDLQDKEINESSGLGASRRYAGLFWTHNDSGDQPRLFLINRAGKTMTTVHLKGANALDWEDMAVAGAGKDAWVYVGDIGDNVEMRDYVTIYRFREPDIDAKNPPAQLTIEPEKMNLLYPGAAHNAETLMADLEGHLLVVTKSLSQTFVYQTPDVFKPGGKQKLEKLGELTMPDGFRNAQTTSGDISADGTHLVIMTYGQMHEWTLPGWTKTGGAQWKQIINTKPRTWNLPKAKQMEAVCYGADGKNLYSTSEQLPTPLWEYALAP